MSPEAGEILVPFWHNQFYFDQWLGKYLFKIFLNLLIQTKNCIILQSVGKNVAISIRIDIQIVQELGSNNAGNIVCFQK